MLGVRRLKRLILFRILKKTPFNFNSLTVPINNKCPECAINHVDLSIDAFKWLEPQGGTVGIAKGKFK